MRRRLSILVVALFASACASASSSSSTSSGSSGSASTLTFDPQLDIDLSAMTKTATGLYIRDFAPGSGPPTVNGDLIRVRYTLNLANGKRIEGLSSEDPPFEFRIGARQVIKGWEEGMTGMRAGGRRQIVVPPSLGYGGRRQGDIPGASVLIFNIHLIEIVR